MPAEFLSCGDAALVVQFGEAVDAEMNNRVMRLDSIVRSRAIPGVVETVPTFRSLMIHYDPLQITRSSLMAAVEPLLNEEGAVEATCAAWSLPVCFDPEYAPDLEDVARRTELTPERVIDLYAGTTFRVYMIGFLPGHPYMGDLPPELELPRRVEPRTRVPAGSVAIATTMTVVYPNESPGGWHLIGRTPVPMFSLRRERPVLFAPGDRVRCRPVTPEEYRDILERVDAGAFRLEPDGEVTL